MDWVRLESISKARSHEESEGIRSLTMTMKGYCLKRRHLDQVDDLLRWLKIRYLAPKMSTE